jgi:ABC-type multidrug transport system fused ATPase/permease subunit
MVKKFWKLLESFHKMFGWFVLLLVIYEALQILDSYVISLVIRLYGEKAQMTIWVIIVAGLVIYDELFTRLDNALDWQIVVKQLYPVYKHLKTTAISKFLEMDMSWHQDRNSGALVGKVNNGVDKVSDLIEGLSWEFVPTMIQTLLSLIPLLIFSPQATLVASVALGIFMWLTIKSNAKRMPLRSERHDFYETEWHKSIEGVQSVETIVMFGQEDKFLSDYKSIHDNITRLGTQEMAIANKYGRWQLRILSVARRLILVIWIWQLYQGSLTVANLVFVNVLAERLFHSFWRFARLFNRATEASEGAGRLIDLTEAEPAIVDNKNPSRVQFPVGISMKGVCFSYSGDYLNDNGAIHSLNLEIEPASIVALVGPSGAGKTTLRRILTRLVDIQSGEVRIGGIEIKEWSTAALRCLFSYVPQGDDVFIYSASVRENIALPRPDVSLEEIENASKLAGIHDFISKELEDGYDTLLGERGKKLSGGQKQRVALARAILADRPILILDEATSAVDAITEREIQSRMQEILDGRTAVIIAHRLSTVWNLANKIVVLNEGHKVEEGTHAELMGLNGLYAQMVALQTHE